MAAPPFVCKLYLHECRHGSCPTRYSKFPDPGSEERALNHSIVNVPIIHRQTYKHKAWYTHSFTIQNPAMRAHLKVALASYQDFDLELENWTFRKPYEPIVHRWDRLLALCEETVDEESNAAIGNMMAFLRPILAPSVNSLAETRNSGKVTFDNVWQIFPPGELAVTTFFSSEVVCRVLKYEKLQANGSWYWSVTMEYVDWNGEKCGYDTTRTIIKSFEGYRFVTSLPVYPLPFSKSAQQIKQRLVERGRKVEALRGYHFRSCTGTKILTRSLEERPV